METANTPAPTNPDPLLRGGTSGWAAWIPAVVIAGIAFGWWVVFYPGLLSYDSVDQYRQGVTGQYLSIRPPVMAITVAAVRRLGGDIQHLMLLQCEAALLGVYFLGLSLLRFIRPTAPPALLRLAALAATLLMLVPISPLPFYLMTFWTDVWVMVCFCWMGVAWLQMMQARDWGLGYGARLTALLACGVVMVLVRHNSVILLPAVALMVAFAVYHVSSWRLALPALALPVALYLGAHAGIKQALHPAECHLENMVYAFDLAGLCIKFPDLRPEFPHTAANLAPNAREVYYRGYMNLRGSIIVAGIYERPDLLRKEIVRAAIKHPLQLARVKLDELKYHFIKNPVQRFEITIHPNEFGLVPSQRFSRLKGWLTRHLYGAFEHRLWRWPFVRHGVWLAANVAALAVLFGAGLRRGGRRYLAVALFLFVPLTYYASYFVASLSAEFRYMYPSDVVMQSLALSCLCAGPLLAIGSFFGRSGIAERPTSGPCATAGTAVVHGR